MFRRRQPLLRFTRQTWRQMVAELGRRGRGISESGAFLLSPTDEGRQLVTRVIYLDDLDSHCLQGAIHFDGSAYSELWDICDRHNLRVIGDVHTHPGSAVRQSGIDRENPMVAKHGHVALILPHLATRPVRARDVGVHQYFGSDGWVSHLGRDAARLLHIGRWS